MKNLLIILITVVISFTLSCKEEEISTTQIPDVYTGNATAQKNNEDWKAYSGISINKSTGNMRLGLSVFNDDNLKREALSILRIPVEIKKIEISANFSNNPKDPTATFYNLESDGDAVTGQYDLDTTKTNFIQITHYDSLSREVQGSFQVHFVIDTSFLIHQERFGYPDTLSFKNGKFTAVLPEE